MTEANKDEALKCKTIAQRALDDGDTAKAIRFLEKAKRMTPSDTHIDTLIQQAQMAGSSSADRSARPSEGPRQRPAASAPSGARAGGAAKPGKAERNYTSEQMQLVQKILRTKDYYALMDLPANSSEEAVKKAYKKLALKLHPDKNQAPGAEEAFKKVSKAVQCLTDPQKKEIYDRYGDEEQIPQQHRHSYNADFMTAEDVYATFFGVPGFHTFHTNGGQNQQRGEVTRGQIGQALPLLILLLLTAASNFTGKDNSSRFSFTVSGHYRNERQTAELNVNYYVADDFDDHYAEGTRALAEFERQVEVYHIRQLHGDCDYQEKLMHKRVVIAKRKGNKDELQEAKNSPRPACKQVEKIKRHHNTIYRSAMYMVSPY